MTPSRAEQSTRDLIIIRRGSMNGYLLVQYVFPRVSIIDSILGPSLPGLRVACNAAKNRVQRCRQPVDSIRTEAAYEFGRSVGHSVRAMKPQRLHRLSLHHPAPLILSLGQGVFPSFE